MRFLSRAIGGMAILLLTAVLLTVAASPYLGCAPGLSGVPGLRCVTAQDESARRGPRERVFIVKTDRIAPTTAAPVITAYGEVWSGRSLELRAAASGRLVSVSDRFREGEIVEKGERLFVIDPADAADRQEDASAALIEAEAELNDAEQAERLAEEELEAARSQRRLRAQALERRRGLQARGFTTAEELETAELALADAERAVISGDQALASATRRLAQARQKLRRAQIAQADATRDIADTEFVAPYAGILQDVEATLGRLVSVNEQLGALIDPTAMEVVFRVSDADFARMLDEGGRLARLQAVATLGLGAREIAIPAVLDRVSSTVVAAEGGRRIFARLRIVGETALRPGDFVTVRIEEPEVSDVAVVPASAVDAQDRILILGEDERLRELAVEVVRRQGDTVLLRGAPEGAEFVVERRPGLGEGVKARASGGEEAYSGRGGPDGEPRVARGGGKARFEAVRQ